MNQAQCLHRDAVSMVKVSRLYQIRAAIYHVKQILSYFRENNIDNWRENMRAYLQKGWRRGMSVR